ncbi:hypothetical protein TNCT_524821 [Trichonephila clavata]|uniref:Uncharacterized protein n=1 Tax=Trichonephila clavata TaxID=2740835 RepID=A0A8X6GQF0_TRICU|nr:hypothetical protein TNCT_524821 [Trichonephila clavata]
MKRRQGQPTITSFFKKLKAYNLDDAANVDNGDNISHLDSDDNISDQSLQPAFKKSFTLCGKQIDLILGNEPKFSR